MTDVTARINLNRFGPQAMRSSVYRDEYMFVLGDRVAQLCGQISNPVPSEPTETDGRDHTSDVETTPDVCMMCA